MLAVTPGTAYWFCWQGFAVLSAIYALLKTCLNCNGGHSRYFFFFKRLFTAKKFSFFFFLKKHVQILLYDLLKTEEKRCLALLANPDATKKTDQRIGTAKACTWIHAQSLSFGCLLLKHRKCYKLLKLFVTALFQLTEVHLLKRSAREIRGSAMVVSANGLFAWLLVWQNASLQKDYPCSEANVQLSGRTLWLKLSAEIGLCLYDSLLVLISCVFGIYTAFLTGINERTTPNFAQRCPKPRWKLWKWSQKRRRKMECVFRPRYWKQRNLCFLRFHRDHSDSAVRPPRHSPMNKKQEAALTQVPPLTKPKQTPIWPKLAHQTLIAVPTRQLRRCFLSKRLIYPVPGHNWCLVVFRRKQPYLLTRQTNGWRQQLIKELDTSQVTLTVLDRFTTLLRQWGHRRKSEQFCK